MNKRKATEKETEQERNDRLDRRLKQFRDQYKEGGW